MIALLLALALSIPPCNSILLALKPTFPPDGTWTAVVAHADGPWLLVHGDGYIPDGYPHGGTWKGCDFWPFGTLVLIGPLVGDVYTTFVPPPGMDGPGCWQVISATQTSPPICVP